ncbi:adhesion G protein-coupled receptor F5 isoform X23 [Xyrichtys novacula]|uniref:Adhesion G protein-coupled receptor F5 isoform X23 n=1 Tax=Xyrichtys novacula TaxID=13765 RepID=A0AAV1GUW3_XYRNO|nr:adhesion G protein-coupled receptor F5 isoform X23 [Xyrichtys novacula]
MGSKASHTHVREKRDASLNPSSFIVEITINGSDLESLRAALNSLNFPVMINNTAEITSIEITTGTRYFIMLLQFLTLSVAVLLTLINFLLKVCSSTNTSGFQCRCQENFAWSRNVCLKYGVCDPIVSDTCGCITALPNESQSCQSNRSQTELDIEVVLELNIPDFSLFQSIRNSLKNLKLPVNNQSIQLEAIDLTTVCFGDPSPESQFQCQCEEQYAWSCDMCTNFTRCNNATEQTCTCINGDPGEDFFPNLTTVLNTTTVPNTTALTMTTVPTTLEGKYFNLLELDIPDSSFNISNLRDSLRNLTLPFNIKQSIQLEAIILTTVCFGDPSPESQFQCQCEEQYAWSCDMCTNFTRCNNATEQTCTCINGDPGEDFCKPITGKHLGPSFILANVTVLLTVLELDIPDSSFNISNLRDSLRNLTLPFNIKQSIQLEAIILTTVCFGDPSPESQFQCQCEEQYAWSCDMCTNFTRCNNATEQTCTCINGIPVREFCKPITATVSITTTVSTTTVPSTTVSTTSTVPSTTVPTTSTVPSTTVSTTSTVPSTTVSTMSTVPSTTVPTTSTVPSTTVSTTSTVPSTTVSTMSTVPSTTVPTTSTVPSTTVSTTSTVPSTTVPTTSTVPSTTVSTTSTVPSTTVSTTSTVPVTTVPITTVPTTVEVRNFNLTLEEDYDPKFNDPTSEIYINSNRTIQEQCRTHILGLQGANIVQIMRGSTIVEYSVRATEFPDDQIKALKSGVFLKTSETYRDENLKTFEVITGENATLSCDPPLEGLGFGDDVQAKWRVKDKEIKNDSLYSVQQRENGTFTLLIKHFLGRVNDVIITGSIFMIRWQSGSRPGLNLQAFTRCNSNVNLTCSVDRNYVAELIWNGKPEANRLQMLISCLQILSTDTNGFFCMYVLAQIQLSNLRINSQTFSFSPVQFQCNDTIYGLGNPGNRSEANACNPDETGTKTAECQQTGEWLVVEETCILQPINNLLEESKFLSAITLPGFLKELKEVTEDFTNEVLNSSLNINATVEILAAVANSSIEIGQPEMTNILITVGILTTEAAQNTWESLNDNSGNTLPNSTAEGISSRLLWSVENITERLVNKSFSISTEFIILNRTTYNDSFDGEFNSSVEIELRENDEETKFITVITFLSLENVLPAREETNSSIFDINGRVVLVKSSGSDDISVNITLTFDIINDTLGNPQCVFWNFTLFEGLGGWDDEGCMLERQGNGTVTCNCNHRTSFSILMSPKVPDCKACSIITFIGIGVSMASLVITLIIEVVIWKKIRKNTTSYLRHVSIVNIAVSLLIADIWFIVGGSLSKGGHFPDSTNSEDETRNEAACSSATFFIHFFYLALFFWMLASALLLFYRTVSVFGGGLSKRSMLAIGFCLGYGAPLIIAVITIAVLAPSEKYTDDTVCWLSWDKPDSKPKALLAFVIPALLIVVINLIILIVIITKMLRRRAVRDASQAAERNVLLVIARSLAVLTPIFGLTWGLGIGTLVDQRNIGIHIAFSFFNSLQGFFVLVFGLLLDKKVRSEIAIKSLTSVSGGTRVKHQCRKLVLGGIRLFAAVEKRKR